MELTPPPSACAHPSRCPDNSVQDNSARTIRRKVYNINLLVKPRFQSNKFSHIFHHCPFHFSNTFSSIPPPFQQYFFVNLTSISAIFFINSRFHLSSTFSSIPLPYQQYFSSVPLPFQQYLFVIK